jgi:hypothetical protein
MERGRGSHASVLLVEADPAERDRLGDALERSGFDVLDCTGPAGPDYVCIGGRAGRCPLVDGADVVVLDLSLPGDDAMLGTPSSELVRVYVAAGRPLVTLGSHGDRGLDDEGIIQLTRRPPTQDVVRSVRSLTRRRRETS